MVWPHTISYTSNSSLSSFIASQFNALAALPHGLVEGKDLPFVLVGRKDLFHPSRNGHHFVLHVDASELLAIEDVNLAASRPVIELHVVEDDPVVSVQVLQLVHVTDQQRLLEVRQREFRLADPRLSPQDDALVVVERQFIPVEVAQFELRLAIQ